MCRDRIWTKCDSMVSDDRVESARKRIKGRVARKV